MHFCQEHQVLNWKRAVIIYQQVSFYAILQEKIRLNYDAIKFRPEHFVDYLLSDSVGFATFEVLEIPQHKASGKKKI